MSDPRRALPAVNWLLEQAEQVGLQAQVPRAVLIDAVRQVLAAARDDAGEEPEGGWLAALARAVEGHGVLQLRRVINATGVVLHTNLGRAPLAAAARRAVQDALGYAALEYDLNEGARSSRQSAVAQLLCGLTGAEAALVTNNAAAALLLSLNSLAEGRETIVSRGELVEIGGSFRLPEIMAKSGSVLIEVGTTNRTRLDDYALALSPRTGALLKVHRSNFRMSGFVEEAGIDQLAGLGHTHGLPVLHDVGSGLLLPLDADGLSGEPVVGDSVRLGATVIFSGDKLLGGPQAGIVVGPRAAVDRLAANPLARALRPDKATLAALEATLILYRDPDDARQQIPVLAMLTVDSETLAGRAHALAGQIPGATTAPGESAVGGGAYPESSLPTTVVRIAVRQADTALERLRANEPPVIGRIEDGQLVLDPRTLTDDEVALVAAAIARLDSPSP